MATNRKRPKRPRKQRPLHVGRMVFWFPHDLNLRDARRIRDWLTRWLEWQESQEGRR